MIDLLKPLLDWNSLARQTVDATGPSLPAASRHPFCSVLRMAQPSALTAKAMVSAICWAFARFWRWIIMQHASTHLPPAALWPSIARRWKALCSVAAGWCCHCHDRLPRISRSGGWRVSAGMTDSSTKILFHGEALFRAGQRATISIWCGAVPSALSTRLAPPHAVNSGPMSCSAFPRCWHAQMGSVSRGLRPDRDTDVPG